MYNTDILIKELELTDEDRGRVNINYALISRLVQKESEKNIIDYLENNGYKRIGIYGGGVVGKILFDLLRPHCPDIAIIDSTTDIKYNFAEAKFYSANQIKSGLFDVVIITPLSYYNEIASLLKDKGITDYVSVSDIVSKEILRRDIL